MNSIEALILLHQFEDAVRANDKDARAKARDAIVDAIAGPAPEDRIAKVHRLRQIAADATFEADCLSVDHTIQEIPA